MGVAFAHVDGYTPTSGVDHMKPAAVAMQALPAPLGIDFTFAHQRHHRRPSVCGGGGEGVEPQQQNASAAGGFPRQWRTRLYRISRKLEQRRTHWTQGRGLGWLGGSMSMGLCVYVSMVKYLMIK